MSITQVNKKISDFYVLFSADFTSGSLAVEAFFVSFPAVDSFTENFHKKYSGSTSKLTKFDGTSA